MAKVKTSGISWTDETWNPITGCSKVSEGCRNCYAKELHDIRHKAYMEGKKLPEQYAVEFENPMMHYYRLEKPYHWKRPRKVFVNSMSDLFHPDVPFNFIREVFKIMRIAHWHTFQILTKRPGRALEFFKWYDEQLKELGGYTPLPNVWFGTTTENQEQADKRLPILLLIPAVIRFVSVEPLLGRMSIRKYLQYDCDCGVCNFCNGGIRPHMIDWVILGCESGSNRRKAELYWFRDLIYQCINSGTKIHLKQIEIDGKIDHSHILDGKLYNEMPEVKC